MCVCWKCTFYHWSLNLKSQQNRIELVTTPGRGSGEGRYLSWRGRRNPRGHLRQRSSWRPWMGSSRKWPPFEFPQGWPVGMDRPIEAPWCLGMAWPGTRTSICSPVQTLEGWNWRLVKTKVWSLQHFSIFLRITQAKRLWRYPIHLLEAKEGNFSEYGSYIFLWKSSCDYVALLFRGKLRYTQWLNLVVQ